MGDEVNERQKPQPSGDVATLESEAPATRQDYDNAQKSALNQAQKSLDSLFGSPVLEYATSAEKFVSTKAAVATPETQEKLKSYSAVLALMDSFDSYSGGQEKITKAGLKELASARPELKGTIDYALKNFDALSGGGDAITKNSLKQPLVESLTGAVKSSLKDGNLSPEVQAAIGSWALLPDAKSAAYLEQKLNENMKGSGFSFSIKPDNVKGPDGKDIPIVKISLDNKQTGDKHEFAYTTDAAGASALKGKLTDNNLLLLDKDKPGAPSEMSTHLSKFNNLNKLDQLFNFLGDKNGNGILSDNELAAQKDPELNKFVAEHFKELADRPKGDGATISMKNLDEIKKKHPELAEDLAFLEKAMSKHKLDIGSNSEITLAQLKDLIKNSDEQKRSPTSSDWSKWDGTNNRNREKYQDKRREDLIAHGTELSKSVPPEGIATSKLDKSMSDSAYAMDKNKDGILTKDEIDAAVKNAKTEQAQEDARRAEEVKQYEAAAKRLSSIMENFSKLSSATGGDAPGVSKEKVREAQVTALAEALASSIKSNGSKMPTDIRDAFQNLIGVPESKEKLAELQKALNAKLAESGYELDLSVANKRGPHGDSVREISVKLTNKSRPADQSSFSFAYDTVRGRGR